MIPRSTYLHLASVLRTAESALRRLIILFMKVKGIKAGAIKVRKGDRPLPDFASFGTGENRPPKFNLIDSRKPISSFLILSLSKDEEEEQTLRQAQGEGIEFDATPVNPTHLLTRLAALNHALKTLPQQAKRMAREIEKRKSIPSGIKSVPPIRIGYPPGYRERHIHDVDHVLKECHGLVMDWERSPP